MVVSLGASYIVTCFYVCLTVLPSVCALAALATSLSAMSSASAGERGSSRVSPITNTLIRVSSSRNASVIMWRMRLCDVGGRDVKGCDVGWCDVGWCDVGGCDVGGCDVGWCDGEGGEGVKGTVNILVNNVMKT